MLMQSADWGFELRRKLFHISSVLIPLSYIFIPKLAMIVALAVVTSIILYVDMSRHYNVSIKSIVDDLFTQIIRQNEVSGTFALSGMSFFFMGMLIVVTLFPKGLAITSIFILIFADAIAALVGIKFGNKLSNGKSIEGSGAFFCVAMVVSFWCYFTIGYDTTFWIILLSSLLTTLAEFHAAKLFTNDNILIPLTYALSTFVLSFIF